MSTISWTKRTIGILSLGMAIAACSSDKSNPAADGGGGSDSGVKAAVCGDGKISGTEVCDGMLLGGKTCSSLTMGAKTGLVTCSADCKSFVQTACVAAATGGTTGAGGTTGTGGKESKDAGKEDAGKEDSGAGGSGGTEAKDSGKEDAKAK